MMLTPLGVITISSGFEPSTLPAAFDRHVHDYAAGFHSHHHFRGDDARRFSAEKFCGCNDYVRLRADFRHALALKLDLLRRKLLSVALRGLPRFAEVDFHELCAEALYLLFDDGARVESVNPRAETLCGCDCLQARDAHADYEEFERGNRARGSHHHREDFFERVSRLDYRDVAREVRLRAEDVHFLGDCAAGNHLETRRGNARVGESFNKLLFVERVEEAEVERAALEIGNSFLFGFSDCGDEVGIFCEVGVYDVCARRLVFFVGEARFCARARFNVDRPADVREFPNVGRNYRDPWFRAGRAQR